MTDSDAAKLNGILEALEATVDDEEASELDAQFHEAICELAQNSALTVLLRVFRSRSRSYQLFGLASGPEIKRQSDLSHREILNALIHRDPATAAAAAASHVIQTEHWLRQHRPAARVRPAAAG
jgi:DNA-binding FadR family transcriptional regulator